MVEHRELKRWKTKRQVSVRIQEREEFNNCILEDINLRGMCVGLPQRLPQHSSIKLGLELADGITVDVSVLVPWVKKMVGYYKHGVIFSEISDEGQQDIKRYILNSVTKN